MPRSRWSPLPSICGIEDSPIRVAQIGRVHSAKRIEARELGVCIMNLNIYLCSRMDLILFLASKFNDNLGCVNFYQGQLQTNYAHELPHQHQFISRACVYSTFSHPSGLLSGSIYLCQREGRVMNLIIIGIVQFTTHQRSVLDSKHMSMYCKVVPGDDSKLSKASIGL